MHLVLIAVLPFIGCLLLAAGGRLSRNAQTLVALAPVLTGLWLLGGTAPDILSGSVQAFRAEWVPALDLAFSLRLDGLAFLFTGLILGIGLLIVIYARFYLPGDEALGRFLSLLLLFQGAMVGISLSGNILLLLVFWELTSLSSFLLIGFRSDKAEGRQGARMALAVTGGGGLALIAGLLLLGHIAGTYELGALLARGETIQASPLYPAALVLILLGCFTKSAQFPFHFWLPHAMAAPTPVSAYLHSATMVKAGVFLMARLWPVLAGTEIWFTLVATTGLVTMLLAAVIGFFKQDLKGILAYSTVSHLGLMTMLLGFGTPGAAMAALFHLLNHALFKAALFMNAGIVDHEAGTRDIRKLGGLATLMPITATLGIVAAASMAGLPPLGGFLSKEMMLEEAAHTVWSGQDWLLPMLAVFAAAFSVAYSLRYIVHLYLGPRRESYPAKPHDPPLGLWAPSALLVVLTVLVGLAPNTFTHALMVPAIDAVTGGRAPTFHPALWHGLTPALGMSVVAVAAGAFLLWRHAGLQRGWDVANLPDGKALFESLVARLVQAARVVSDTIHNGSLQRQLAVLFALAIALGAYGMVQGGYTPGTHETLPAHPVAIVAWLLLLSGIAAVLVAQQQRFLTLVFISVIGLVVSLAFVYLSAPDLALTQISVETVTILLMLLALNLLPKKPSRISSMPLRLRDALIGLAGGGAVGFAAWAVMTREPNDPISTYHWENSVSGGGGHNVVNVTLVDFRGFDTFGEITVLGIAALTIFAMLQPAARGAAGQRLRAWIAELPRSPERHPMMFAVAARVLLPLATIVAIYIFLRGHNAPGGGFIAGLVASIAMLVQYMASGFEWTDARRRIDEHLLIGLGVTIAALTGLGSLVFGAPLFTSAFGHFHLPLLGDFELASAMAFDVGVGMTVIGAVMLALAELSHIAVRANKEDTGTKAAEAGPMDIDPARLRETNGETPA
ncbi:monovalent cation/H+ antiporter subunit A [Novosphingobium sp. MBES04]|uniref:monovalent cation/H+ antiporter subunit A n=1 Tax=Novosphingobium sp. MBES04 TaxID=1206458 RepID=UPI00057DDD74|nr:monovalent cation/H+ antiporter subunit A [Novosphingobium sp. MBES04]GAM04466.1 K(+)/H(+) antiporter subunit A/B [Novosphingobium sp. MBES04]